MSNLMVRDGASAPTHHEEQFLQYLARIHDAKWIEHRLDRAHQLDCDLVLHFKQFVALEHADAVLGGDRSAQPQHDFEYHRIDLMPPREEIAAICANGLADV